MGLQLKNPIIIGSSGLSNSVEKIKILAQNNAGAIVLKSIFEEQITSEAIENSQNFDYPEAFDYLNEYSKAFSKEKYLNLIQEARKNVDIPIIASINASTNGAWTNFAKEVEQAGANAIELNIAIIPVNADIDAAKIEKTHLQILENVKKTVKIPIAVKLSSYQSALANLVRQIAWSKTADAVVLFNRFYNPDVDIDKMTIISSHVYSNAEDIMPSLRWIALLSPQFKNINFAATTGVYTGEDVIKQLLVGADAVQIVSAIYKHGPNFINTILGQIKEWMQQKKFNKISDFKGKLNMENCNNASMYERIQFMKYYGTIE